MFDALGEAMKSFELTEDVTDLTVAEPTTGRVRICRFSSATTVAAVDGKLDARRTVESRDFSMVPDRVPAAFTGLVSHRITAILHLGGASTDAFAAAVKRSLDSPTARARRS